MWYQDWEGHVLTHYDGNCLDYNYDDMNVYMGPCHTGANQMWYSEGYHIKTEYDDNCLDYNYDNHNVYMFACHDGFNQMWFFDSAFEPSIGGGQGSDEGGADFTASAEWSLEW